jgi:nitrogen fixation-related uncharacterized protein
MPRLLLLVALVLLSYAPALRLPLFEDDFPNIQQAIKYQTEGPALLFNDAVFRWRATSYGLMSLLYALAGMEAWVWHLTSMLLHTANVLLLYQWRRDPAIGEPLAFYTAAVFAFAEGHQEAVFWFSACNELLQFFFGMSSLWLLRRQRVLASLCCFALALLSKESAIVFIPLIVAAALPHWPRALPHALTAMGVAGSILLGAGESFRFRDGSFSLQAPFWITLPLSMARLVGVMGGIALAWLTKQRSTLQPIMLAGAWMLITLLPYVFLTYMHRVPSRQTYLASVGLAVLVGLALRCLPVRHAPIALTLLALGNIGYLWLGKTPQFQRRAEPTEALLRTLEQSSGPVYVKCFPQPRIVAEGAVMMMRKNDAARLRWEPGEPGATVFCFSGR